MKLPNGDKAIVTDDKLYGYLVNRNHPTQAGHAQLFAVLLDIDTSNAEEFRTALLRAAATEDAVAGAPSPFGEKFEIRFSMTGSKKSYTILSVWIIETGTAIPRLVTAFVE